MSRDYYRELTEERKIVVSEEDIKLAESLNAEQMEAFNEIFDHVIKNIGRVFFCGWSWWHLEDLSLQGTFGQSSNHRSLCSSII